MDIETATPATGPVDVDASIESILADIGAPDEPDKVDSILSELASDTDGEGQPETDPDTEESEAETEVKPEESDEEAPQEPIYKVKVNGEEIDVPLPELLNGYSRTQDYKAKTAEVAEQRRAVEAERAGLATEYVSELKRVTDMFEATDPILNEARNTNWEYLRQNDPEYYGRLRAALDERIGMITEKRGEMERMSAAIAEHEAAQIAADYATENELLAAAIPELQDPAKHAEFSKNTVDYLKQVGFTQEDISEVFDHRAWLVIDKARKWDAMQTAKSTLPAKKVTAASSVKTLQTDGSSNATSNRLKPGSGQDDKLAWALRELTEG